jgi:hypothetical protein
VILQVQVALCFRPSELHWQSVYTKRRYVKRGLTNDCRRMETRPCLPRTQSDHTASRPAPDEVRGRLSRFATGSGNLNPRQESLDSGVRRNDEQNSALAGRRRPFLYRATQKKRVASPALCAATPAPRGWAPRQP